MKRWVIPITLALEIGYGRCARPPHFPFKDRRNQAPVSPSAPFTSRYTSKRTTLLGSQQKAWGMWNPEPAFLQWVETLDMEEVKKHIHAQHVNKSKSNQNSTFHSTFQSQVDKTLANDKSLANSTKWPGLTKDDWNLGQHHWPSFFFDLAPGPVVDLCGGTLKVTKYSEVSEHCAMWVIQMMRCTQACSRNNRFAGYGSCMWGCSGVPDPKWCDEPSDEKIRKHCTTFMGRWDTCKVSKENWPDADSWFAAIDSCVYPCGSVMETEKMLGQPVSWRYVKCNPTWFACGNPTDPFMCSTIDPFLCEGPVGQGTEVCFNDDPWCGDPHWGCYPQPDPKAELVVHTIPGKLIGEPDTTVVSIYNESGGFVMNATQPRLPYIRAAPPPQWYTIVRPTPFAPKPTKAPTTTPPPCEVNITVNGTFLGMVNGTHNGTMCNYNASHAAALIPPGGVPAGASLLENGAATTRAPLTTMSPEATAPPPGMPGNQGHLKVGTQAVSLTERMHGMLARIKAHPWPMLGRDD